MCCQRLARHSAVARPPQRASHVVEVDGQVTHGRGAQPRGRPGRQRDGAGQHRLQGGGPARPRLGLKYLQGDLFA